MRKTKEELIKELENVANERDAAVAHAKEADKKLAALQSEVKKAEEHQKMFDEMFEAATMLKGAHDAFIKAGFDEEQAFELLINMLVSRTQQAPTVRSLLDVALR